MGPPDSYEATFNAFDGDYNFMYINKNSKQRASTDYVSKRGVSGSQALARSNKQWLFEKYPIYWYV